jgi:hypothetical protein
VLGYIGVASTRVYICLFNPAIIAIDSIEEFLVNCGLLSYTLRSTSASSSSFMSVLSEVMGANSTAILSRGSWLDS